MSNLLSFGCSSKPPALVDRLFVGRPLADAECSIKALEQTGTRVRVIRPGTMVTMDRKEKRVNVLVDKNGNIFRIHRG